MYLKGVTVVDAAHGNLDLVPSCVIKPLPACGLGPEPDCRAHWPPGAQNLGQMQSRDKFQKQLNGKCCSNA